ncbi:DUF3221 domain-containing protein [Robertmurraya kyonggiensis]|uniref:DUF3221 domain-containing protein n=1 Tax=Robertmurraya kyonggiensis TaxID=1037680 RepID=A0A4U1D7V1_9BACI|nr:DUF3221 domain-containing protein [Robertmurraya kyonggiensis]TKC18168.1 DUF3221 domain-containing protein [Robertmurraya kyonggiensis]
MNSFLPYVRLLIASMLVLLFSLLLNEEDKREVISDVDYSNKMVKEGYVISKKIGEIMISDEPIPIWQMLKGFITSDYGSPYLIVHKHVNAENGELLKGLKLNQKVRIYVDSVLESNPPMVYAYQIEVIEEI